MSTNSFALFRSLFDQPYHTAWDIDSVRVGFFEAWERHFSTPESWAVVRELELRDERKAREAERELAAIEWPW